MFEGAKKILGLENFPTELESAPEEIRGLEDPTKRILEQIKDAIEAGEYQLIIGDDASGRIPTRLFGNIITARYREIGHHLPKIRFFAGRVFFEEPSSIWAERVEKCKKLKAGGAAKALLVTDTVSSGKALSGIITALQEAGISYDVATIGVQSKLSVGELENKLGCRIFYGTNDVTPPIYGKSSLSGVYKNGNTVHARRLVPEEGNPGRLGEARRGVAILSRLLLKWYKQQCNVQKNHPQ